MAPHPAPDRDWRAFARTLVLAAAGLLAGTLALTVLVDPYDTGRVALLSRGAVRPQGPRTASAVRGRDAAFTAAVIGDSHIQLVEPAELTRLTGLPFVQLAVPATGPAEQFALLGWFLRHHPHPGAIVLAADAFWCADDPDFPSEHPFPFWLVGGWPGYLRGLTRFAAVQEAVNRVGWLVDRRARRAAADGWWNYEPDYLRLGFGVDPALKARLDRPEGPEPEAHRAGPFPIAGRLRDELARVPTATPVVLVFPPVYAGAEPPPGSPRARAGAACRQAGRGALAVHPASAVVDWREGREDARGLGRDPDLFFDRTHYRLPIARALTAEIASEIVRLRARAPP